MEKKSSLRMNIIYNIAYQILLIITPLITSPYIARVLGTEGVGIYSYTYSLSSCFAMIGLLGVANYGNRMIAAVQRDKEKRSDIFWNIFYVQALFSITIIVVYLFYVYLCCSGTMRITMFIQTLTVVCSLFDINWYFFGVEKFKLTVTRNAIIKILNVILIFLFVKKATDVNVYVFIISASLLLSNLVVWPFLKNEVLFVKPDFKKMLSHIKPMLVLFIPIVAITLYNRMDKVMIGMLGTIDETGLYENTEKIINIPKSLITALGTVMLPRMANLYAIGETKSASSYIDKTMEFTCFASCAMMFGIAGIAHEFAPWFFGEQFASVSTLLIVISPTILFVSWANVIRTQYLIPLKKDKIYVISVWLGAIGNLISNSILIPYCGALGAVIGTVIAEFIVTFYQSYHVRKVLPIYKYFKWGVSYCCIGAIMFGVIRAISYVGYGGIFTLLIEILSGGIVYIILCGIAFIKTHNISLSDLINRG